MSTEIAKYVRVYSPDLTTRAQTIFGEGLVKAAYWTYFNIPNWESHILEDASLGQPQRADDISIPTAGAILIEFANGRLVMVSTSEWGGVEQFTDSVEDMPMPEYVESEPPFPPYTGPPITRQPDPEPPDDPEDDPFYGVFDENGDLK